MDQRTRPTENPVECGAPCDAWRPEADPEKYVSLSFHLNAMLDKDAGRGESHVTVLNLSFSIARVPMGEERDRQISGSANDDERAAPAGPLEQH